MADDEDEDEDEKKGDFGEAGEAAKFIIPKVEPPEPPRPLTTEEALAGLTGLGPSFRKLDYHRTFSYPTYAYIAMKAIDLGVTDVSAAVEFTHVVYLDLSYNKLTDDSIFDIVEMKQLIAIILKGNRLETAAIPKFPKLQLLSLRQNRITTSEVNYQPKLRYLDLNYNNIQDPHREHWSTKHLPELRELGMRGNGIASLNGINFPNLVSLFVGENDIRSVAGIEVLVNLKFLHLRANPLKSLDGFTDVNKKLFYVNLRSCKVKRKSEIKKLRALPRLERIVLAETPFADNTDDYRVRLVILLPKLKRIDKDEVSPEERAEAKEILKEEGEDEEDEEEDDDDEEEDMGDDD